MMRRIGPKGLALIKSFESFVPYVYDDKRVPIKGKYPEWKKGMPIKGTLTIGYGHTDAAKYDIGFKLANVPDGFRITETKAIIILDVDLDECEEAVNRLVKVPLKQGAFDAMTSAIFNFGESTAKPIVARLNAGKIKEARNSLALYNKSDGEYMAGLARRRAAEQALWDLGDYEDKSPNIPDIVLPAMPVHHSANVDAEQPAPRPSGPTPPSAGRPVEPPKPDPVTTKPSSPIPNVAATGGVVATIAGVSSGLHWGYILAILAAIGLAGLAFYLIKKRG